MTSPGDAQAAGRDPAVPDRPTGAGRPAAVAAPGAGFTRRTVVLIVGLCVFAAGCAAVILVR